MLNLDSEVRAGERWDEGVERICQSDSSVMTEGSFSSQSGYFRKPFSKVNKSE